MLEKKFRAWDKVEKEMIEWSELRKLHASLSYIEESERLDARILMQYTGLKDKNGKEIYESDILSNREQDPIEVKWFDGGFNLSEKEDTVSIMWEVIGNKYENPDLLKSGKGDIL